MRFSATFTARMERKFLIHIGLPRTASTWLQWHVFPKLQGAHFISQPYTFVNEAFQSLLFADESIFDPQLVWNEIEKWPTGCIVLSDENWCGQPLYWQFGNRTRTAQRLAQFFPNAHILLVLRDAHEIMHSQYALSVEAGYPGSFEEYCGKHLKPYTYSDYLQQVPASHLTHGKFQPQTIGEIAHFYSAESVERVFRSCFEQVHSIWYHDLIEQPNATLRPVFQALDPSISLPPISSAERPNASLTPRQQKLIRVLNRCAPAHPGRIGQGVVNRLRRAIKYWF